MFCCVFQLYLYEYDEETSLPKERPRQICPMAVVTFKKKSSCMMHEPDYMKHVKAMVISSSSRSATGGSKASQNNTEAVASTSNAGGSRKSSETQYMPKSILKKPSSSTRRDSESSMRSSTERDSVPSPDLCRRSSQESEDSNGKSSAKAGSKSKQNSSKSNKHAGNSSMQTSQGTEDNSGAKSTTKPGPKKGNNGSKSKQKTPQGSGDDVGKSTKSATRPTKKSSSKSTASKTQDSNGQTNTPESDPPSLEDNSSTEPPSQPQPTPSAASSSSSSSKSSSKLCYSKLLSEKMKKAARKKKVDSGSVASQAEANSASNSTHQKPPAPKSKKKRKKTSPLSERFSSLSTSSEDSLSSSKDDQETAVDDGSPRQEVGDETDRREPLVRVSQETQGESSHTIDSLVMTEGSISEPISQPTTERHFGAIGTTELPQDDSNRNSDSSDANDDNSDDACDRTVAHEESDNAVDDLDDDDDMEYLPMDEEEMENLGIPESIVETADGMRSVVYQHSMADDDSDAEQPTTADADVNTADVNTADDADMTAAAATASGQNVVHENHSREEVLAQPTLDETPIARHDDAEPVEGHGQTRGAGMHSLGNQQQPDTIGTSGQSGEYADGASIAQSSLNDTLVDQVQAEDAAMAPPSQTSESATPGRSNQQQPGTTMAEVQSAEHETSSIGGATRATQSADNDTLVVEPTDVLLAPLPQTCEAGTQASSDQQRSNTTNVTLPQPSQPVTERDAPRKSGVDMDMDISPASPSLSEGSSQLISSDEEAEDDDDDENDNDDDDNDSDEDDDATSSQPASGQNDNNQNQTESVFGDGAFSGACNVVTLEADGAVHTSTMNDSGRTSPHSTIRIKGEPQETQRPPGVPDPVSTVPESSSGARIKPEPVSSAGAGPAGVKTEPNARIKTESTTSRIKAEPGSARIKTEPRVKTENAVKLEMSNNQVSTANATATETTALSPASPTAPVSTSLPQVETGPQDSCDPPREIAPSASIETGAQGPDSTVSSLAANTDVKKEANAISQAASVSVGGEALGGSVLEAGTTVSEPAKISTASGDTETPCTKTDSVDDNDDSADVTVVNVPEVIPEIIELSDDEEDEAEPEKESELPASSSDTNMDDENNTDKQEDNDREITSNEDGGVQGKKRKSRKRSLDSEESQLGDVSKSQRVDESGRGTPKEGARSDERREEARVRGPSRRSSRDSQKDKSPDSETRPAGRIGNQHERRSSEEQRSQDRNNSGDVNDFGIAAQISGGRRSREARRSEDRDERCVSPQRGPDGGYHHPSSRGGRGGQSDRGATRRGRGRGRSGWNKSSDNWSDGHPGRGREWQQSSRGRGRGAWHPDAGGRGAQDWRQEEQPSTSGMGRGGEQQQQRYNQDAWGNSYEPSNFRDNTHSLSHEQDYANRDPRYQDHHHHHGRFDAHPQSSGNGQQAYDQMNNMLAQDVDLRIGQPIPPLMSQPPGVGIAAPPQHTRPQSHASCRDPRMQPDLHHSAPQDMPHGMQHNVSHTGMQHNVPHTGMQHNAPHTGMQHNAPHTGMQHNAPHTGMQHNAPHTGMQHNAPHTGMQHNVPHHTGVQGNAHHPGMPHSGMGHNAPHPGMQQHVPHHQHNVPQHPGMPHNVAPQRPPSNALPVPNLLDNVATGLAIHKMKTALNNPEHSEASKAILKGAMKLISQQPTSPDASPSFNQDRKPLEDCSQQVGGMHGYWQGLGQNFNPFAAGG